MPSKSELNAEWKRDNKKRKKEGKSPLTFREWYQERYNTEPPSFITENPRVTVADSPNINEYIMSKIGMEPNAWGSRRRWHFLRIMAKHIHEVKSIDFDSFFVWATGHCQCMKMRTLREDYLDTLERLGFIILDWNNGRILWSGE